MNWIGAISGAIIGSARGGGIIGGLIGSVIGNWVEEKVREYLKKPSHKNPARDIPSPRRTSSPYDILGVPRDASDEEVKRAYREKVKTLHPDTLQGKELPKEVIDTISDQMARINEAWTEIKRERSI